MSKFKVGDRVRDNGNKRGVVSVALSDGWYVVNIDGRKGDCVIRHERLLRRLVPKRKPPAEKAPVDRVMVAAALMDYIERNFPGADRKARILKSFQLADEMIAEGTK